MYNNKMAMAIRVNGKVLRELKDTVYLPFGSEYQVRLKNLNTVRAIAHVFIDGDDITGPGIVINAGQEFDLERAIRNSNLTSGNKLKFIERTGSVENHRGIKVEDGLVRVEFQFEKVYQPTIGVYPQPIYNPGYFPTIGTSNPGFPYWYSDTTAGDSSFFRSGGMSTSLSSGAVCQNSVQISGSAATISASTSVYPTSAPANESGITVPGSKSEQKFTTASWFATETTKHSMILKLVGETADNKAVRTPVTVQKKQKCTSCGKINKATASFCSTCGTALTLF